MATEQSPPRSDHDTIHTLWLEWHELRKAAKVSVTTVARSLASNRTTIYELGKVSSKTKQFQGEDFLTIALKAVEVPDERVSEWIHRYRDLEQTQSRAGAPMSISTPSQPWLRRYIVLAGVAVVAAAVGVMSTLYFTWMTRPESNDLTAAGQAIEVQNMIAVGDNSLTEDSTPAYLSTQAKGFCAGPSKKCKVPGTEMSSGVSLAAVCQLQGDEISNYNEEVGDSANPYRVKSRLWYGIELYDGRIAFISESYVRGEYRGGLSLPTCPAVT